MKKTIFLLFAIMMTAGSSMGQTLKTYSGLYEGGNATYTYYEDENGERVNHGKFTYNRTHKGVGVGVGMARGKISYTETQYASGNYKNGKKDGRWTYKDKTVGKNIVFADFSAIINYVDGQMEGALNCNGKTFNMKNNRITGQVKKAVDRGNSVISGLFDDDGFPDGTWTQNYKADGNLYVDTEKYVHGLLVFKQTKNESTGEITKYEFEDVNPQEYLASYKSGKDSTIVGKLICQEKIYFKQGENNSSRLDDSMLPEIFGNDVREIIKEIQKRSGYGSGQETYEGIPFKEIVVIGKIEAPNEGAIFDIVEQMPSFKGNVDQWLSLHLVYPDEAKKNGIQGRVIVQFVVNRDGSISDAKIVRSVNPLLDEEALRLIKNMPKWNPGKNNNENARCRFTLPVTFKLP